MASGSVTSLKVEVIESTTDTGSNLEPKEIVRLRLTPTGDLQGETTATLETSLDFYFIERRGSAPDAHVQVFTVYGIYPVYAYVYAPAGYDLTQKVTARFHTARASTNLGTKEFPDPEQIIEFPVKSGTIKMSQVRQFFGFGGSYPNLREYVRGGGYVASLKRNEHVPKSPPIRLTDLRNTVSALYFIYKPSKKTEVVDVTNGAGTVALVYNMGEEAPVGYGSYAKDLHYRFIVTRTDNERDYDITIEGNTREGMTFDTGWRGGNSYIKLSYRANKNEERYFKGTLRMIVRNALDHTKQIETTVDWVMESFSFNPGI